MSQHSSLRLDATLTKHRNVLKRHERIHRLMEQEKWKDRQSAFGLPKVKSLKIKVKKIKADKAEATPAPVAPQAQPAPVSTPVPPAGKKKPAPAEKGKK